MNRPSAGPPAPGLPWWRRPELWLALGVISYGLGYLGWHLGTPLGRMPQLDARENLVLAGQIAGGTLPREPFYRAMLYPALLAVPAALGLSLSGLAQLAAGFGLLCHFAATLAVARLAARVWAGPGSRPAALLAAALWGFNPVALFYAVDVLDTAPALALFLWGLVGLSQPRARHALGGGVLLGLAVAARPNFLPVAWVAPLACAWLQNRRRPARGDFAAWGGAAVPLLALGLVQLWWGGELRILPWQGAYNFYAANHPGANGRYFAQQLFFADLPPGMNPARRESEILYLRETGAAPPPAIGLMEAHWRSRARAAIAAEPGAWVRLLAHKAVFVLHDFDQYNNKTYAWHQQLSPWLRWNGLGWGVLLLLAAPALVMGLEQRRGAVAGVLLIAAAYGAGLLLYYASGRFRLPLSPLLCALIGGWAGAKSWRARLERKHRPGWLWAAFAAGLLALLLAFAPWFGARDDSTFIQDELLMANAAAELAEDAAAEHFARLALARDPARPDARRIALVSHFNRSLDAGGGDWPAQLPLLAGLELRDPTLALVAGVAHWKTGEPARAEQIWAEGAQRFGSESPPARALAAAQAVRGALPPGAGPPDAALVDYLRAR